MAQRRTGVHRIVNLRFLGVTLALLSSLCIGCSDDRVPTYAASGTVLFSDGTPVKTGVVEFQSVDYALNARGEIGRNGSFTLGTYTRSDGAVAGKHRALVVQFFATESQPDVVHDHGEKVDRKFASYETSGLEFDISAKRPNVLRVVVEQKRE